MSHECRVGRLNSALVHPTVPVLLIKNSPLDTLIRNARGFIVQESRDLTHKSLRIGFGPKAFNHSLYQMRLARVRTERSSASYPEENFGENQLLDSSISLSPLYLVSIDLHVRIATDLHFPDFVLTRHSSFGSQRVRSEYAFSR